MSLPAITPTAEAIGGTEALELLDARLNALVTMSPARVAHTWWARKVAIKQALAVLPVEYHDVVAKALLSAIGRGAS